MCCVLCIADLLNITWLTSWWSCYMEFLYCIHSTVVMEIIGVFWGHCWSNCVGETSRIQVAFFSQYYILLLKPFCCTLIKGKLLIHEKHFWLFHLVFWLYFVSEQQCICRSNNSNRSISKKTFWKITHDFQFNHFRPPYLVFEFKFSSVRPRFCFKL